MIIYPVIVLINRIYIKLSENNRHVSNCLQSSTTDKKNTLPTVNVDAMGVDLMQYCSQHIAQ